MSSTTSSASLTSAFIDLATFDEPEKYYYGGSDAVTYFVKKIRKSTWFSVCPTILSKSAGSANFNNQWSVNISRAGDYLLRSFCRLQLPSVALNTVSNQFTAVNSGAQPFLRWTKNFMHNLIKEVTITFNDLVEMRFDNYYLDFWSAFTIPAGKSNGYNNMIGNVPALTNPGLLSPTGGLVLPQAILNLPLPLCHSRDTGVSLPTAALPYNEMKINFNYRDLNQLLILSDKVSGMSVPVVPSTDLVNPNPQLSVDVWAEYAIVSNTERQQMGAAPRDILIEQVQTVPVSTFNASSSVTNTDIRLSHSIKALMFSVRNKTNGAEWSNYTSASPYISSANGVVTQTVAQTDPIGTTSLLYESTQRLSNMGSDYFSLVVPWYTAVSIPLETGYHLYSYSLDLVNVNPMGSTNYGKLTNVSLQIVPSADSQNGATLPNSTNPFAPDTAVSPYGVSFVQAGLGVTQTYELDVVAVNHNIVRISGGALGFPVL